MANGTLQGEVNEKHIQIREQQQATTALEQENQQLRTTNQILQKQCQENESQLNELREQLWFQRMKHKVEKPCDAQPLRVAELADFKLGNRVFSSCGQFGSVHGVHTNWTRLEKRINIPPESERRYWEIVALKMLFNFNHPRANPTEEQKNLFDQEYFLPLTHPHWSIIQVFNYFRSDLIFDF
jgi:hypothetical protein